MPLPYNVNILGSLTLIQDLQVFKSAKIHAKEVGTTGCVNTGVQLKCMLDPCLCVMRSHPQGTILWKRFLLMAGQQISTDKYSMLTFLDPVLSGRNSSRGLGI